MCSPRLNGRVGSLLLRTHTYLECPAAAAATAAATTAAVSTRGRTGLGRLLQKMLLQRLLVRSRHTTRLHALARLRVDDVPDVGLAQARRRFPAQQFIAVAAVLTHVSLAADHEQQFRRESVRLELKRKRILKVDA